MNYKDIPKLTQQGHYQVNQSWRYIKNWLAQVDRPESPLILQPEFQRAHVWTEKQQREYVEYILRGGHSSKVIYFNCSSWMNGFNTPLYLVDGLQRLTAVLAFLDGKLEIFDGHTINDMEEVLPFDAEFLVNINNLKTDKEVLQWYIDLNAGGTPHTDEEIDRVRRMLDKK